MHIWVASWVTGDTDRHGRTKYDHMAFGNLNDAKRRTEGVMSMVVDWYEHRDSTGKVDRVEGMLEGASYGHGSPAVIERVDVFSPSAFITELTRS